MRPSIEVDLRVEVGRGPAVEAKSDEVLHHLLLPVHGHGLAVGQLAQGNPVTNALDAQLDAVMRETFATHAFTGARRLQEIRRTEFNDTGTGAFLHVGATATFEDDVLDAFAGEELSQ